MSENVPRRYRAKNLPHLADLYERSASSGLIETGSSSIESHFNEAVEEVKRIMFQKCGVWPSNITTAAMWRAIGDPSATFYFSGYREVDGQRAFVPTDLYLAILIECIDDISADAVKKLEKLAKGFAEIVAMSARRFPLVPDQKYI